VVVVFEVGNRCLKEWQIKGLAGMVVGGVAGSESGPGALATAGLGALVN